MKTVHFDQVIHYDLSFIDLFIEGKNVFRWMINKLAGAVTERTVCVSNFDHASTFKMILKMVAYDFLKFFFFTKT